MPGEHRPPPKHSEGTAGEGTRKGAQGAGRPAPPLYLVNTSFTRAPRHAGVRGTSTTLAVPGSAFKVPKCTRVIGHHVGVSTGATNTHEHAKPAGFSSGSLTADETSRLDVSSRHTTQKHRNSIQHHQSEIYYWGFGCYVVTRITVGKGLLGRGRSSPVCFALVPYTPRGVCHRSVGILNGMLACPCPKQGNNTTPQNPVPYTPSGCLSPAHLHTRAAGS